MFYAPSIDILRQLAVRRISKPQMCWLIVLLVCLFSVVSVQPAHALVVEKDILYGYKDTDLNALTTKYVVQPSNTQTALFWNTPLDNTHVTPGQLVDISFSIINLDCFNATNSGTVRLYWADAQGNMIGTIKTWTADDLENALLALGTPVDGVTGNHWWDAFEVSNAQVPNVAGPIQLRIEYDLGWIDDITTASDFASYYQSILTNTSYNGTVNTAPTGIYTYLSAEFAGYVPLIVDQPTGPTATLNLSTTTITQGQSATLTWSSTNATSCVGTGFSTGNASSSSTGVTIKPSAGTYTYSLTCYDAKGVQSPTVSKTLVVTAPTQAVLNVYWPPSVNKGTTAQIRWDSNGDRCDATNFSTGGAPSGQANSAPLNQATTFTITCTGAGPYRPRSKTFTINVTSSCGGYTCNGNTIMYTDATCNTTTVANCTGPAECISGSSTCIVPPPTFVPTGPYSGHLEVKPPLVGTDKRGTVFWNVTNVQSCTVTGSNGLDSWNTTTSGPDGQLTSPITQRTTYTLNCTAYVGAVPKTITESKTISLSPQYYSN